MKQCAICNEEKDLTEFCNHKKSKDGRRASCKKCEYAKNKAWADNNPEKIRAIHQRKYLKSKESIMARCNKYRTDHKIHHIEVTRKWQKANPERVRQYQKISRDRLTDAYIRKMLIAQGWPNEFINTQLIQARRWLIKSEREINQRLF